MKLLIDMNLSPRWVALLEDAGFEAVHWSTVGQAAARDTEVMRWAAANDCVVVTHDLDFSAILAATQDAGPSVVQIRTEDVSPEVIGARVITALRQMRSELEGGALLSIDVNQARIRLLPLKGSV